MKTKLFEDDLTHLVLKNQEQFLTAGSEFVIRTQIPIQQLNLSSPTRSQLVGFADMDPRFFMDKSRTQGSND
jgi:hypothetical protein